MSSARRATGSDAASISLRKMMPTAPCGPITAISADGHANARSEPIDFESMTTYAPPYPLRVMICTRGTVASQYAYSSLAPCRMIPPYFWSVPGGYHGMQHNGTHGLL